MGKPFSCELKNIENTLRWAEEQDVSGLRTFMLNRPDIPLLCVGSGGSASACSFASILYRDYCGLALSVTPLMIQQMTPSTLIATKKLYISASGNNKDILQAVKRGISFNHIDSASFCTSTGNKLEMQTLDIPHHHQFHYNNPVGKDGFLATNSLVAFFSLLIKAFNDSVDFPFLCNNATQIVPFEIKNISNFENTSNFIVIYGKWGEPIAIDIESKLSEAGLASTMICDFRNFGHGRHNWFDKQKENSCLVAIITPEDDLLACKTIDNLPSDIPVVYIKSDYDKYRGALDLLIKSFHFVEALGRDKGIDPGRPGVPDYGTALYHLSYQKLIRKPDISFTWQEAAICRKAHVSSCDILSDAELSHYKSHLEAFINRINHTEFEMVAFDYDGTLCGSDKDSRHSDTLLPQIKKGILNLLAAGVKVAVISGRGKSIRDVMNNEIPEEYKHLVFVGHYNGLVIYPLDSPVDITSYKESNLSDHLLELVDLLKVSCAFVSPEHIESRKYQVTIANNEHSNQIAELCREIIFNKGWHDVAIWQSTHSIDIVITGIVDKRNILTRTQGPVLCIGDCGSLNGNDFQLLSTPYSLSVGTVSFDPETCWNLAPYACNGVNATLFYIGKMKTNKTKVKLSFKNE